MDLLYKKPALGHTLIQSLIVHGSVVFEKNNLILHNIYLQCLHILLSEIDNNTGNTSEMVVDRSGTNSNLEVNSTIVGRFCDILSMFDPPKGIKGPSFTKFLEDLCKVSKENDSPLKLDCVYSCFLGRSSQFILDEFSEIWSNLSNGGYQNVSGSDGILTNVGRSVLGLCQQGDSVTRSVFPWKDLYLLCLKHQKHFLDTFIVSPQIGLKIFVILFDIKSLTNVSSNCVLCAGIVNHADSGKQV